MTALQKLQLRASEIRVKLNELAGAEELTPEQETELGQLTTEYRSVERRIQAATIAADSPEKATTRTADGEPEPEADPEERERRELLTRANLGSIFDSVVNHAVPDGAERELQEAFGLGANVIPVSLLADPASAGAPVEARAVTPAPGEVGQIPHPIIPAVFPASCAAFLGVDMPSVGVGEQVFTVLTTGATVAKPAKGAAAAESTGAFTAEKLSPSRLQTSFRYSREDRSVFAGMAEALRMNLSDALADELDKEILAGTNGLLTGSNLTAVTRTGSAAWNHDDFLAAFLADRVDGRYAMDTPDLRAVVGTDTFSLASRQFQGTGSDVSALDRIRRANGGVRVSAHVPATASNSQFAVVRRGMRRDMVAPVWEGITLIPDEVTRADEGEIKITAVMLYAVKLLRAAGFAKLTVRVA